MQEQYFTARAHLRQLLFNHPEWTNRQFASELQMSVSWAKDWKRRLREADLQDEQVLLGCSTARYHLASAAGRTGGRSPLAVPRRATRGTGSPPGPKALRYYLEQDEDLRTQGLRLPRSTNTIHRLLKAAGRITHVVHRPTQPWPLRPAGMSWQMDFKDTSSVPVDPLSKH